MHRRCLAHARRRALPRPIPHTLRKRPPTSPDFEPASAAGTSGRGRRRAGRDAPETASQGTKVVLHVGCGVPNPNKLHPQFRGPDWRELRLDIDPGVRPDIVGTIVDLSKVKAESVDAVWSSHNMEHIYAHEVPLALHGFFRVIRRGGSVRIATPDLQWVARIIVEGNVESPVLTSELGPITPLDIVYGHGRSVRQGNDFMAHRTGFTAASLEQKLRQAGFDEVAIERGTFELSAHARKPA